LRREDEIDEHEREHEDEVDFAAGRAEFARLPVKTGLRRRAERDFGGLVERFQRFVSRWK
jgi:hypothetical protein